MLLILLLVYCLIGILTIDMVLTLGDAILNKGQEWVLKEDLTEEERFNVNLTITHPVASYLIGQFYWPYIWYKWGFKNTIICIVKNIKMHILLLKQRKSL